tara:strand:- start:5533 stop:5745 length:213 start_codon:yes stop_codon:yes gene_type:complete
MKVGDLVKYIPSPSALFKWEKYKGVAMRKQPGILVREIDEPGTTTRRFEVCWHGGHVTCEWASHLEKYEV